MGKGRRPNCEQIIFIQLRKREEEGKNIQEKCGNSIEVKDHKNRRNKYKVIA